MELNNQYEKYLENSPNLKLKQHAFKWPMGQRRKQESN